MHQLKFSTGVSEVLPINKDIFEEKSLKIEPYYSTNTMGEEIHYAVCPQCDNPIQIIGLYKKIKNTENPYGKHFPADVEGLAMYNQEAYNWCPYARKTPPKREDRKKEIAGIPSEILELLRTQFDRVIYMLSSTVGFKFSENLLRSMLKRYIATKGYLYTGATINNLPWMFGYMADSQSLLGQLIQKESELKKAISDKCLNALFLNIRGSDFVRLSWKEGVYLNINFSFILHKGVVDQGEFSEQVDLVVHKGQHYDNTVEIIYQKTLSIDSTHFMNLIKPERESINRNEKYLKIAKELLGE